MRATTVIFLAVAAPVVLTVPARAQPASAIQAYLRKTNATCEIDSYKVVYRGPLAGATSAVTVATFGVDACGGGNNGGGAFGIFSLQDGAVREWKQVPPPEGRVAGVSVRGSRIIVVWRNWKQSDPMCCPSLVHTTVYALKGGQAVQTR